MASERIKYLVEQFINQRISDVEKQELANWINHGLADEELSGILEQIWQKHKAISQLPEEASERIKALVFLGEPLKDKAEQTITASIPHRNRSWLWIAAAAFLIILFSSIVYVKVYHQQQPLLTKRETPSQGQHDIPPGGNKAVLTLSNGTQIVLDSASNGLLATQGSSELRKRTNGDLAYISTGSAEREIMYNTMTTPRGGQYKLTLPDGTLVWLNAASSIRFPTAFTGNERKVTITGEAYFEVAPLYRKGEQGKVPFIVHVSSNSSPENNSDDGMDIQVLGTHFNVNAYTEEDAIRTTLLEGSVKILKGTSSSTLSPGQQVQLQKNGKIKTLKDADTQEAVAWKDGYFQFNSSDLPSVLRQAARWYNVEVEFAGDIPKDRFTGKISRTVNLSRLLQWMQWSDVHFKLDGRKITILP